MLNIGDPVRFQQYSLSVLNNRYLKSGNTSLSHFSPNQRIYLSRLQLRNLTIGNKTD